MKCLRPLAVDAIILCDNQIVLVRRRNEPYKDMLALPGGFVETGETVEEAVVREAREESGLDTVVLGLVGVYSNPGRDPRGPVVSICYLLKRTGGSLHASSDASHVELHSPEKCLQLAFDHRRMIEDAMKYKGMNA